MGGLRKERYLVPKQKGRKEKHENDRSIILYGEIKCILSNYFTFCHVIDIFL